MEVQFMNETNIVIVFSYIFDGQILPFQQNIIHIQSLNKKNKEDSKNKNI